MELPQSPQTQTDREQAERVVALNIERNNKRFLKGLAGFALAATAIFMAKDYLTSEEVPPPVVPVEIETSE